MAPLSGFGFFRVSENGRFFLTTKCEHYHAPLGHSFPGYRLLEHARRLGIPNATHNNTRGTISRKLEEDLICAANGIDAGNGADLARILDLRKPNTINRVLNLETGSLAVEAALKMILARFYRCQGDTPQPKYEGFTPVMLVIGNDDGGLQANYHGTTLLTQVMRGMWPKFAEGLEKNDLFRVRAIRPNRLEDLESTFQNLGDGNQRIAGFFHEIVMMNYGARLLSRDFLRRAYQICVKHDVPTVVDEIQSCMWAPGFFLYREYGLEPTFVAVGKGFPGGEYPASRILFSSEMDNLPQFGALVTNGQEELASLAYLITMAWARANTEITRQVGDYYEERLREFANEHSGRILGTDGNRHMTSLCFHDLDSAKAFVGRLVERGLDISVQTYKED
jgi:acetylornithine/succinyldiaminopimelate/putrescine aminotransferase